MLVFQTIGINWFSSSTFGKKWVRDFTLLWWVELPETPKKKRLKKSRWTSEPPRYTSSLTMVGFVLEAISGVFCFCHLAVPKSSSHTF